MTLFYSFRYLDDDSYGLCRFPPARAMRYGRLIFLLLTICPRWCMAERFRISPTSSTSLIFVPRTSPDLEAFEERLSAALSQDSVLPKVGLESFRGRVEVLILDFHFCFRTPFSYSEYLEVPLHPSPCVETMVWMCSGFFSICVPILGVFSINDTRLKLVAL